MSVDTHHFSYLWRSNKTDTTVWDLTSKTLPGVRTFMRKLWDGLINAQDTILTQHVKQLFHANQKRQKASFAVGDLVYLSTEDLSILKGRSQKLSPKYISPYRILEEIVSGMTYKPALSSDLLSRGVHDTFHANLLHIHISNDNWRFLGRSTQQISSLGGSAGEILVKSIRTHVGKAGIAWFEVLWESGDITWLDFESVQHLSAFDTFGKYGLWCDWQVCNYVEMLEIVEINDESNDEIEMNLMVFTDKVE